MILSIFTIAVLYLLLLGTVMYRMREFKISCVVEDIHGVIHKVGIWDNMFTVQEVAIWIIDKTYRFYTNKNGYKTYLKPRRTSYSGRLYLTTDPNDKRENNLDFLPYCSQSIDPIEIQNAKKSCSK